MAEEGVPLGGELDLLRGLAEMFQETNCELVGFGRWMRMGKDVAGAASRDGGRVSRTTDSVGERAG